MTAHEIDGALAALCEELRILARARSPLAVSPGALPALEALAETGVGVGDLDAVHTLVGRACALLPRREAAAVALLFADDDDRWQRNLTERMTLAGAELGFRYDAFRRRSGTDRPDSHYDVLLTLLAEALFEAAIAGPPGGDGAESPMVDLVGDIGVDVESDGEYRGHGGADLRVDATASDQTDDEVASPEPARSGATATDGADGAGAIAVDTTRSRILLVGFAAVLLALVAVVAVVVFGSNDDESPDPPSTGAVEAVGDAGLAAAVAESEGGAVAEGEIGAGSEVADSSARTLDVLESVPVEGCDVPLGGSMNPVALPEGLEALIADAFADTGGLDAIGCPLRTVELWDRLWYQEFVGGELPPGRILADPVGGVAVWVDEGMYFHYERSGGGNLQALGGLPVGIDYESPHPLLLLSGGGAMVAHYLGGPAHWVPVEGVQAWNELGGADGALGLPMADVNFFDGRPGQEWSGGYGERSDDGTVAIELVDAATIADAVAALPRRSEGILRLYDETAYWIDDQGRRRWIPDGETWVCLGGADALIEPETPGWVVGAFAPGPNATCP